MQLAAPNQRRLAACAERAQFNVRTIRTVLSPAALRFASQPARDHQFTMHQCMVPHPPANETCALTEPVCEGKYGGLVLGILPCGHYPEVISAITSLFILWCGIHMLLFFRSSSYALTIVAASFAVNGWSAFVSHILPYEDYFVVAIVDRLSIMWTAWFVLGFMLDQLCDFFQPFPLRSEFEALAKRVKRTFSWTAVLSAAWVLISKDALCHNQDIVVYGTAAPLGGVVVVAAILIAVSRVHRSVVWTVYRFWVGFLVASVGIASDALTEQYCDESTFAQLFPGHAIWHVCFAWGTLNMVRNRARRAANHRATIGFARAAAAPHGVPSPSDARACSLARAARSATAPCSSSTTSTRPSCACRIPTPCATAESSAPAAPPCATR